MYNVFTDFHHASLLNSLILLFEKRLGGNVYRPIGMEWAERGYWKVYDHPATQAQFLGIGAATPDGSQPLNQIVGNAGVRDIFYNCYDIESGKTNKAITFEGFMLSKIDIVIASIPAHIEPFKRLCAEHPNHPKLIYQIGNAWTVEAGLAPNVMASAKIDSVPREVHFIQYHQEFDTKVFKPEWPITYDDHEEKGSYTFREPKNNVFSFVNCFGTAGHFQTDWQLFKEVESAQGEWNYRAFGGQCRDGSMDGSQNLANKMREARFIWHTKNGGDGFGHVIHNAAAVGRPLIVKKSQYVGKMADALLIDGLTCINIDGLLFDQITAKIHQFNDPETYPKMCKETFDNFCQVCNFDQEFSEIKVFLENLK